MHHANSMMHVHLATTSCWNWWIKITNIIPAQAILIMTIMTIMMIVGMIMTAIKILLQMKGGLRFSLELSTGHLFHWTSVFLSTIKSKSKAAATTEIPA
jgi:hypothetical protein